MQEPILLDVESAAKALSVSANTVRKLASEKKINPVRIGSRMLFRPADICEYVDKLAKGDPDVAGKKRGRPRLAV